MSVCVQAIADNGTRGIIIDVECSLSNAIPNIVIVGFANKAVDEAKERLRGAFTNSRVQLPRNKRITINLAPADLPKSSAGFDLAMAAAIMAAGRQVKLKPRSGDVFIGELGLDGAVRPVRGIIGKLLAGREQGLSKFYVPIDNLHQALLVPGIIVFPVKDLHELYLHLSETIPLKSVETGQGKNLPRSKESRTQTDFEEIIGQVQAKRAMEIVAAGGHNILLNGPPGTGKSMLAKALPSILPPLNHEQILEVTHLHSLANKEDYEKIIDIRPFRSPHHSASDIAIIGGGQNPRPGEISLAHRGVLFFDEFPEFSRRSMEALRQPLEDKTITVARVKDSINYPANFVLVATSNPCPCGYYGTKKACRCLPHEILRYQRKISGPIMDRIDLCVSVESVEHDRLLQNKSTSGETLHIKKRVLKAREKQARRYNSQQKLNSDMTNKDIKTLAQLSDAATSILNQAARQMDISARSYMKSIKVARTIADLEDSNTIEASHIAEALQYSRRQQQ